MRGEIHLALGALIQGASQQSQHVWFFSSTHTREQLGGAKGWGGGGVGVPHKLRTMQPVLEQQMFISCPSSGFLCRRSDSEVMQTVSQSAASELRRCPVARIISMACAYLCEHTVCVWQMCIHGHVRAVVFLAHAHTPLINCTLA